MSTLHPGKPNDRPAQPSSPRYSRGMTRTEELLQEALALPNVDGERMIEELSLSLDPVTADDADLAILEERVANMLAHPERAAPLEEAVAAMRAAFARRRQHG